MDPKTVTRTIDRPDGRYLVVTQGTLTVTTGPDKGKEHPVAADVITIGTDESCTFKLSDRTVSKVHCRIAPRPQGFRLEDLGSTNGTRVDGVRIDSAFVDGTKMIAVGETRIQFKLSEDELEIPLSSKTRFGELLGHSDGMRAVFSVLEKAARTDATILLLGESGTGKDVAARAIHAQSSRAASPLIPIDCGAMPPSLIESELFGYAKGAFTGADTDRAGPFEQANGGTVFLDEFGELPLDLQPRLLRALETREVRRVGETTPRPFDARIIAATNRNLMNEVQEGKFRQDLYYRLSVVTVHLPPLRERVEEIPRLIGHFLKQMNGPPVDAIPDIVVEALSAYPWPGNVRELRNAVQRLAVIPGMPAEFYLQGRVNTDAAIEKHNATLALDKPFYDARNECIENFERAYLAQQLEKHAGNVSEVARVAQLSRQTCYRIINRHGLNKKA